MNPQLLIAIINLVAKVGIDAAVYVLNGLNKSTTIDEAIAALEDSAKKTWEDYKREALANPAVAPAVSPAKDPPCPSG